MTVGRDPSAVAIGAGTLYYAPIGTTEPTTLTGAWAAGWVDLGYTENGSTFTETRTTTDLDVAEEYYPLSTAVTAKTGMVAFQLAQITALNMQVVYAGGTISTAGGVQTFDPPAAGSESRVMLGWQSKAADERYIFRQCFATGNTARAMQKGAKALLDVSFNLEKPTGLLPWRWIGSNARAGS